MRRKRIAFGVAALLFLMLFLSGCNTAQQFSYAYGGSVDVTVGHGTRSSFSAGRKTSVCVEVEGEYASRGNSVTLTVPTNEGDFYCYRKQIEQEGMERAVFVVPVAQGSSQMVVEVLDEKNRVIYSRTCYYQFADAENMDGELVIGAVGDFTQNELWNFTRNDGSSRYQVRSSVIRPENLLELPESYQAYNLLILDADASDSITKEQKEGLKIWQERGGNLLILGTQKQAQSIGFPTEEMIAKYEPLKKVSVTRYKSGRGTICMMNRDVFLSVSEEEEKIVLLDTLLAGGIERELRVLKRQNSFSEAVIGALDAQKTSLAAADKRIFYGIFIVYLGIVFPGVVVFLRKRDKMRFFRLFMCAAACVVCCIIWIAGYNTRFTEPFLHTVSLEKYVSGKKMEHIYFSVQAPYNQNFSVSLKPEYMLEPLDTGVVWQENVRNNYGRHTAELTATAEENLLYLDNLIAFSPRYFTLSAMQETDCGITGERDWDEDGADAALVNRMQGTLYDVAILAGNRVYLLEKWEDGEELILSEAVQEGRCQKITLEQFLSGNYRHFVSDDISCEALYGELLQQCANEPQKRGCVIAGMEGEADIQEKTSYTQNSKRIVQAEIAEGR